MVLAYIRISTNKQDIETQKLQIFKYAHKEDLKIERCGTFGPKHGNSKKFECWCAELITAHQLI